MLLKCVQDLGTQNSKRNINENTLNDASLAVPQKAYFSALKCINKRGIYVVASAKLVNNNRKWKLCLIII